MLAVVAEPELVDVVVIGLGVGGEEVAGRLAEAGLTVVGVERELVGGECPYWGCVPSKMMIRAANAIAEARRVDGLAGTQHGRARLGAGRERGSATRPPTPGTTRSRRTGSPARAAGSSAGSGRLDGPGRVRVGDQMFGAGPGVVVATGTEPVVPPIDGLADTPYWTNREAIEVEELPESLVVLGGGAIGLELAQVFARFGVRVTVVEALDRLLASRSRRRPRSPPRRCAPTAWRSTPGYAPSGSSHDGRASHCTRRTATALTADAAAGA